MKAFTQITARVIPLAMNDVDTDMIIPAQYLTSVDREGYGKHLFQRLREQYPGFVFNNPSYQQAEILVAQSNFGCGSSREHAVWALMQAGIKVVIAESYSDIFYNNALKNGLLVIKLPEENVSELISEDHLTITVDLESQAITVKQRIISFEFDAFRKTCFLKGQDDLDYLLEVTYA